MYSTDTNLYYMYGKLCTKREIISTIDGNQWISYIYGLDSTPVYRIYNGSLGREYSNSPSKVYMSDLVIPEIYKVTQSAYDGGYYGYKLSLRDLDEIYSKYHSRTVTRSFQYQYRHAHKRYTYHGKVGRLIRFYAKANSEGLKIRHDNRYKSYKKRYSRVLCWDDVSSSSSGWKSRKKRHQWD